MLYPSVSLRWAEFRTLLRQLLREELKTAQTETEISAKCLETLVGVQGLEPWTR